MNQSVADQMIVSDEKLSDRSDSGFLRPRTNIRPAKTSLRDRIDGMSHRIEYRRMVDFEDREAVYHLRRDAYSRHRGDSRDWGATAIDAAFEPNAVTIGLFIDNKLVGSFKVTVVTAVFPESQSRNFFSR